MSFKLLALGIVTVLSAAPAWGWDDEGHMMVAAVAWDHLGDASRARVTALLNRGYDTRGARQDRFYAGRHLAGCHQDRSRI